MDQNQLKKAMVDTLAQQNGLLFAEPAIVHRITYSGRDILAKNSRFEKGYVDERGYVPVEWWIMSMTQAGNAVKKAGEGITRIQLSDGASLLLTQARELCEQELFGNFAQHWPLTKILDIGGAKVKTSFGTEEVPPIPPHVHFGEIVGGKATKVGKKEAYFLPPLDVAPYNKEMGKVITRLGLKPTATKEQFLNALKNFGKDDVMYTLLNEYEAQAYDCWTIQPGIVHAPGPWLTFEIQKPQDDYNLCGWKLGMRLAEKEHAKEHHEQCLRGLKDEQAVLQEVVDWQASTDAHFKQHHYHEAKVLEQGDWGRRLQIFFDGFYGEALEVKPKKMYTRPADEKPYAGMVWSGTGELNDQEVDCENKLRKEFLVTPNTLLFVNNMKSNHPLLIYTVFPIEE